MNKKILKAAICAAVTVAFAVPAFAAPFNDVPKTHWAYDAVNKLQAAGIVDGYGDGTYKGDKTMTRYEMAQIVAKAMGKVSTVDQKVIVDKLAGEFGKELNDLGVKVDGIQKQLDNQIKFSGDARVRYTDSELAGTEDTSYRFRLGATGKINEDTSVNVRLTTEAAGTGSVDEFSTMNIDRFNVNTNILGLDTTIGRQDLWLGNGLLYDTDMTGAVVKTGNLMAAVDNSGDTKLAAVEYNAHIFGKDITADYLNFKGGDEFAALSTDFNLFGKKVDAEFVRNINAKADGYKVSTNVLGATVGYIDFDANALPGAEFSTFDFADHTVADNGFTVDYVKGIAKNTNLEINYKDLDVAGAQTKVAVNVKF